MLHFNWPEPTEDKGIIPLDEGRKRRGSFCMLWQVTPDNSLKQPILFWPGITEIQISSPSTFLLDSPLMGKVGVSLF